jgi:hypothetical protein
MKKIFNSFRVLMIIVSITMSLASCEYNTDIRDAEYPDQKIYMPAAYGGNFVINDIPKRIGDPVTPGQPFRFVVDMTSRNFNVPLSVYRSGINNKGSFTVDIAANSDTINSLITAGKLVNTLVLPVNSYSVVSSVQMIDGEEIASFNLEIDLDFLLTGYPTGIYAIGVGISSPQREVNPKLATTIVVIDTKIMKPTAGFSFSADAGDPRKIKFTNTSLFAPGYSWNFGDGSSVSAEASPIHVFATPGTYIVTLTASGITGSENTSILSTSITVL